MGKEDMDLNPINVVCFYWNGNDRPGWEDSKLGKVYIEKLFNSVKRNTTLPYKFHCITTLEPFNDEIHFHKLDSPTWKGCLPKYSMFDERLKLKGGVFSIDLDVVITGNLDELFSYDGSFATRSTFRGTKESGGDIVAFEGGTYRWIWEELVCNTEEVLRFTGGRERWVYRYHPKMKGKVDFLQDLFPDQIFSYKAHCSRGRGLHENARIVSCHGNPRPHEIKDEWVIKHWR